MLKRILVVAGMAAIYLNSSAQNPSDKDLPVKKMFLHSQFGIQLPGFSSLNDELIPRGFNPLSAAFFSRGAGFYTIFPKSRLVSFANYQTYAGTKKSGGRENAVRGTIAGSGIGYNLVNHTRAHLIPFIGLQYTWFGVRLSKTITTEQDFDDYLGSAANQNHIASNGFMGTTGIQAAFMPFSGSRLISNAVIGLKISYSIPVSEPKWKSNNTDLRNGPNSTTQGLFTGLVLGIAL